MPGHVRCLLAVVLPRQCMSSMILESNQVCAINHRRLWRQCSICFEIGCHLLVTPFLPWLWPSATLTMHSQALSTIPEPTSIRKNCLCHRCYRLKAGAIYVTRATLDTKVAIYHYVWHKWQHRFTSVLNLIITTKLNLIITTDLNLLILISSLILLI